MKSFARIALLAIAASAGLISGTAQAQQACPAPASMPAGRMPWFGGFSPSDDLLTAWCRLQSLPGTVKFNVLFPQTQVHQSWETSFQGANLPANRIVELVQSLLPTSASAQSGDMAFYRVLENVVQAGADKTSDGVELGFTKSHPSSRELMLWEPIVLRIKPVVMASQEFTLNVILKPSLGMFAMGQQKKATDVRFLGAKERMNAGNRFTGVCSSAIPHCDGLGEVVTFHAPWLVTGIRLDAEGENLTNAALTIIRHMETSQAQFLKGRNASANFNTSTGSGRMMLTDGVTTMTLEAKGNAGGTKSITIAWQEEGNNKQTVASFMRDAAISYRLSKPVTDKPLANPDILNRL
jgi:hypothetical protein